MKHEAYLPFEGRVVRGRHRAIHRSLFLSDIHLGTRMCRAESLLSFLAANEAETIYLVGDVVDNWRSPDRAWPAAHIGILRHFLDMAREGTRVVYVPGNHDAFFRAFVGSTFQGIEVRRETLHRTSDGRRFLVTHGDQCDWFSHRLPVFARAGSLLEDALSHADAWQRRIGLAAGFPEWRGIERLVSRTNALMRRYDGFEGRLCGLARRRGFDGIICGHFHQPALSFGDGIVYANCGDWTEHATAIVEDFEGTLRLVGFDSEPDLRPLDEVDLSAGDPVPEPA